MKNWVELIDGIEKWADSRGITTYSTAQAQLLKAVSEMGELCDAEIKGDEDASMDGVGDVIVCLIIYCQMRQYPFQGCVFQAYEEIKNRKGKMVAGGAFVKDE